MTGPLREAGDDTLDFDLIIPFLTGGDSCAERQAAAIARSFDPEIREILNTGR